MIEDDHTEFKEMFTKECIKTIVAFSNTCGGSLYIGVSDDGTAIGVDDSDSVSLSLVNMVMDSVRPSVSGTVDISTTYMDGKEIIKVDVREGPSKPYYLREKGLRHEGVYIRKGPSSVPAPDSAILAMIKDSTTSFESTVSFEQDLTFDAAERIFSEANLEFGSRQKASLGFYSKDLYTNLALLISDQCPFGLKIAAYSDRYKTEFLDREEIAGSVLLQVEDALAFIKPFNHLRSKIGAVRRMDLRAYPESTLREAIINAVVHRDYSANADTLISIFSDGITITSYGGLMRDVGLGDIMAGISVPRNPELASIFYHLGYIEAYGTGIPRMMGDYRNAGAKPSISLTDNTFKVEIPEMTFESDDQKLIDTVMRLAREKEEFARSDAEAVLRSSRSKAGEILSGMVEEGLIERAGNGRTTRYRIARRSRGIRIISNHAHPASWQRDWRCRPRTSRRRRSACSGSSSRTASRKPRERERRFSRLTSMS